MRPASHLLAGLACASSLIAACNMNKDQPVERPVELRMRAETPPVAPRRTTISEQADRAKLRPTTPRVLQREERVERPAEPGAAAAPAERDLSAELAAAFGDPSSCIPREALADLPDTLRADVEVYVTANGVVSRASASGPGFPPSASPCLVARARAVRLRAPIDGAPRAIRASVTINRPPAPPAQAPPAGAPPPAPAAPPAY